MTSAKTELLHRRANKYIPGGAHTYSKGDDQFPSNAPKLIEKGKGCFIWDTDGNKFVDFGMSLGTVLLGHAFEPVLDAVRTELEKGVNFLRPSPLEGELAELLSNTIPGAEMVKLGKHGSDATTAAVKLARAYTGRNLILRCEEDPFNSVHDWFIGSTVVSRGVPQVDQDMTLKFKYNDLEGVEALFSQFPNQIACVIFEPISFIPPKPGFLEGLKLSCEKNGAILIFDEVVSGFRFALGGVQEMVGVTPHLSAFGKAMANGFSVSALVGQKDIMKLGGFSHDSERVFLMSATHGGETHSIAAAIKTIQLMKEMNLIEHFWKNGKNIQNMLLKAAEQAGFSNFVKVGGYSCKPTFAVLNKEGAVCMRTRTLFLQETIKRGLMMPYIVPSYVHTEDVLNQSLEKIAEVFALLKKAYEQDNVDALIEGSIVKPVFRKFN